MVESEQSLDRPNTYGTTARCLPYICAKAERVAWRTLFCSHSLTPFKPLRQTLVPRTCSRSSYFLCLVKGSERFILILKLPARIRQDSGRKSDAIWVVEHNFQNRRLLNMAEYDILPHDTRRHLSPNFEGGVEEYALHARRFPYLFDRHSIFLLPSS